MNGVLATWHVLEQTPPPTLREILGAYTSGGDGDRDMLLALLNAKSAEDQRLASVAALQKTMLELEVYRSSAEPNQPPQLDHSNYHAPPTCSQPGPKHAKCPQQQQPQPPSRHSPPHPRLPSIRDTPVPPPSRKRHRSSHSQSSTYSTVRSNTSHEQLPPSPYSCTSSDSPEYSPRSRASMAIGSLLSSGPDRDTTDDAQTASGSDRRMEHHVPPPPAV